MEGIERFVEAVWETDETLCSDQYQISKDDKLRNPVFHHPDTFAQGYEHQRITTLRNKAGKRTDFFELYWADIIQGTTYSQVFAWLVGIFIRWPHRVPPDVRLVYGAFWLLVATFVYLLNIPAIWAGDYNQAMSMAGFGGAAATVLFALNRLGVFRGIFLRVIGDVPRYVNANPNNIAARNAVRKRAVDMIVQLHKAEHENKPLYDRIIVVGHSLGSVIAHDALGLAFARMQSDFPTISKQDQLAIFELEALCNRAQQECLETKDFSEEKFQKDFQPAQDKARLALNKAGDQNAWIVSDFISLGSPLTHAEFLLADSQKELREQQSKRKLWTCPPVMEQPMGPNVNNHAADTVFTYRSRDKKIRIGGQSVFAFTRWTNFYSPTTLSLWGDLVSGPLKENFGCPVDPKTRLSGIREVDVMRLEHTPVWRRFFTRLANHTKYWNLEIDGERSHLDKLRDALRLKEQS